MIELPLMRGVRTCFLGFALAGVMMLVLAVAARAGEPPASVSREAMEEIVRDYILKHPETIVESLEGLRERERAQERERTKEAIASRQEDLLRDAEAPVGGNPQGDVAVVEFFDYRCPHCKSVAPIVRKLLQEEPNVRLVYKEFPILGAESHFAARAALAAYRQGKYGVFHDALMAAREPLTTRSMLTIAAQVGLELNRLKKDMEASEIRSVIEKNRALAQAIGIRGTPAFIVGEELLPGVADVASLRQMVARARSKRNVSKPR